MYEPKERLACVIVKMHLSKGKTLTNDEWNEIIDELQAIMEELPFNGAIGF